MSSASKAAIYWDRYAYPDWLRVHSTVVGRIAELLVRGRGGIDADTVVLAAYLHDIGRTPLMADDPREHNLKSAEILTTEGLTACGELALRHPIYAVHDPAIAPRTLEEKIVFIADRRGGQRVESIEERSADTARRHPQHAEQIARAIPIAKEIEREVFADLPFAPDELAAHLEVPR